jgi:hypothetical protein
MLAILVHRFEVAQTARRSGRITMPGRYSSAGMNKNRRAAGVDVGQGAPEFIRGA